MTPWALKGDQKKRVLLVRIEKPSDLKKYMFDIKPLFFLSLTSIS